MSEPQKPAPEILALRQAQAVCLGHMQALKEALDDLAEQPSVMSGLEPLDKNGRRLLDQFAYRYTRLQDDMGARLMPSILQALGEDVAVMPALDRFARLEQLGWLPSAQAWGTLRQIRNQFTHDYTEDPAQRAFRLQAALRAARELSDIMAGLQRRLQERFP